jgi:sulfatase maturation enzyme AslB (radical SAM superfamily)
MVSTLNPAAISRLSIELTNRCSKGCAFCYNASNPEGSTAWTVEALTNFVSNCASNGVHAVSFGGGEPLEFPGVFDLLQNLRGRLFRSITTNGLPLTDSKIRKLAAVGVDKVHISIHYPDRVAEVDRVIRQVLDLQSQGVRCGVNLLVARSTLSAAGGAAERLRGVGICNDRIVYLPVRGPGADTPSPGEIARVAGNVPFQSMTCLGGCARSERFCSIRWDQTVAWCSYTTERRRLGELTFASLLKALDGLGLRFCGEHS